MSVSNNLRLQHSVDFSELIERYDRDVFGLASYVFGDVAEAEDAAQKAVLQAYAKLPSYESARSPFTTWMLSLVTALIDRTSGV